MRIGAAEFDTGKNTYIMGILNVTPDSFSDGGRYNSVYAALIHTEEMIEQGADIIDIGAESTRPGHGGALPEDEELKRLIPVLDAIDVRFDIPISVDTYKSRTAQAALEHGADLINDIWGLKYDSDMAGVIAKWQVPCCLMHNRKNAQYTDFIADVLSDMWETLRIAEEAGIAPGNIILDPGIGFAKSLDQNLSMLKHLDAFCGLGYPVLLGTSRKSVIGLTLGLETGDRLEGTLATTVIGVMAGCSFVRVHDVSENARAIRMTRAVLNAR